MALPEALNTQDFKRLSVCVFLWVYVLPSVYSFRLFCMTDIPILPLSRFMAIKRSNSQTRSRAWGCPGRWAPVPPWTAQMRTTILNVKVMGTAE